MLDLMGRIVLDIPMEAVGKARPRFYQGKAITPKKTVHAEQFIRSAFLERAGGEWDAHTGPVTLIIAAHYRMPKSWPAWKKELVAALGESDKTTTPDCDNIAKTVLDALNGYAFVDDRQVTTLVVTKKWWAKASRLQVTLMCYEALPATRKALQASQASSPPPE